MTTRWPILYLCSAICFMCAGAWVWAQGFGHWQPWAWTAGAALVNWLREDLLPPKDVQL